jgi:Uncharacterized conserved protein
MLDFHIPALEDKACIDGVFEGTEYFGCFCAFATLWLWKDLYYTEVARFGDALLIRGLDEDKRLYYMYPLGKSYEIRQAVRALREDAAAQGTRLLIYCAEKWQCDELRKEFPGEFAFCEQRGDFDYIYRSENLISLIGKKFHAKRNHISKFKRNYPDWRYEDISDENIHECIAFAGSQLEKSIAGQDEEQVYELCMENSAIALALTYFDALGLVGGLLRVGGSIVAITIGEPLNSRVFVTHFEKADTDFEGVYSMINQCFAFHRLAGYEYVNREEDMDREGLRRAKLSYFPDILLEKYRVEDIVGRSERTE